MSGKLSAAVNAGMNESTQASPVRSLLAWGGYPFVMCLGMGFALWMARADPSESDHILYMLTLLGNELVITQQHLHSFLAYFSPVLFSAIVVGLMERYQTFSELWRPSWKNNVFSDLGVFLVNNVVLRSGAIVAFTMAAAAGFAAGEYGLSVWPSHWPMVIQVVLFLLLSELMTYWLHRLQHENLFLWRMHCVHHNPTRLYWLNATRFHFFDIIAMPILGNVPAILLGADMTVIYLATTFSVMHGFWQHGNIQVRFGWLNYVVSSPELHRWHHNTDIQLANHNYGSNLIVWDLVFGTWMLPKEVVNPKQIGAAGLAGDGVLKQVLMPFTIKKE